MPDDLSRTKKAIKAILDDPNLTIQDAAKLNDVRPSSVRRALNDAGALITCPCCGRTVPRGRLNAKALKQLGITVSAWELKLRQVVGL